LLMLLSNRLSCVVVFRLAFFFGNRYKIEDVNCLVSLLYTVSTSCPFNLIIQILFYKKICRRRNKRASKAPRCGIKTQKISPLPITTVLEVILQIRETV
jgi:hypothetical protein